MKDTETIRKVYYYSKEEFYEYLINLDSYKEIRQRRNEKEELLENCLSKTDYKLFDEYITCENEMTSLLQEEAFIKGFQFANKLIIESLK